MRIIKERFAELEKKIKENNLDVDVDKIENAFVLAYESHVGQKRKSGEDYILHPIEVAEILVDLRLDTDTIVAGILHDVVEDTLITIPDIEYNFGKEVARLVDGVTKLRNLPRTDSSKRIENIRKMVVAMSEDIRVVLIKLADRLHNMRTLKYMKPEKQIEKAKESLEIYAPIAHRIGMAKIKWELEDISFRYLYPEKYKEISTLVKTKRKEREKYTNEVIEKISGELKKFNIQGEVTGRPKHLYSIYKKMVEKQKNFNDLHDLIAIRILVNKEVECYNVLGIIHSLYIPVAGRFKDYIAVPKSNGYQSIHTTIEGPDKQNIEVQIRTYAMHMIAEEGVAAHWKYKEKKSKSKDENYYAAVKKMIAGNENVDSFVKEVTDNVLNETIFVFTPKGDVIELQNAATPLDFAFHIHTQIGYKTVGAKVNDKIVPLDYELKNGDKIEILTSKNSKGPGKDWINMVKANSSKVKIRKWFKDKEFEERTKDGELLLERELEKINLKFKDIEEDEKLFLYMKKYNINDTKSLFYKFATGELSLEGFTNRFEVKKELDEKQVLEEETLKGNKRKEKSTGGIRISGTDNTMYKFAKCCTPLPGDDIQGFVTKVRGIVIHRKDCKNLHNLLKNDPDRAIDVEWDVEEIGKSTSKYEFVFTAKALNRPNILMDIIKVFNDFKMDLINVNTTVTKENGIEYSLMKFDIMIKKRDDFDRLANNLKSMKDIVDIIR